MPLALAFLLSVAPAWSHGAFHDRLRELAAALENNPRDARLHFELAKIFCQHGDWLSALASADSADEFQPAMRALAGQAYAALETPSQ